MSEVKKQLIEREQRLIREAYQAEERERQQCEANAYTYALKQCGFIM